MVELEEEGVFVESKPIEDPSYWLGKAEILTSTN
jgi:hypothetical protein